MDIAVSRGRGGATSKAVAPFFAPRLLCALSRASFPAVQAKALSLTARAENSGRGREALARVGFLPHDPCRGCIPEPAQGSPPIRQPAQPASRQQNIISISLLSPSLSCPCPVLPCLVLRPRGHGPLSQGGSHKRPAPARLPTAPHCTLLDVCLSVCT